MEEFTGTCSGDICEISKPDDFLLRNLDPLAMLRVVFQLGLLRKGSFSHVLFELRSAEILLEQNCRALLLYDPLTESFKDIQFKGMQN
ncbi:hypothetical protein PanWU01x14_251480 [Parasponia andersonii]|uniref:Uncharacterized protein n=1 Tax=Parasponia andersonii TaxID=3476 RepID=A0A2P5BCJ4_PARAD|nr:hypothetical protein PanWU01x14_251480 [Parasponia andersonii]